MKLSDILAATDLTQYERNSILFLSCINSATATEICKNTLIPQGRVYGVLRLLVQKGFVEVVPTSPKRFKIISVKDSLKKYLSQKKDKLDDSIEAVRSAEIPAKHFQTTNDPSVAIINGRDEHVRKGIDIMDRCQKTFKRVAPIFKGTNDMRRTMQSAILRGARLRILITGVTIQNKENIRACIKCGVEIRVSNDKRMFGFMVSDSFEGLVGTEDYLRDEERTIVYTRNAGLMATLEQSFDEMWAKAKHVKQSRII